MMLDQHLKELAKLPAIGSKTRKHGVFRSGGRRTSIRFLRRIPSGVHGETVLEIIDAQLGNFAKGNRAEVTCDSEAALVGNINHFLEFGLGDVRKGRSLSAESS